jgi:addiction module RelE/StbE family toxin
MRILFRRTFTKQYDKLPTKIQTKFDERLKLWLFNPDDVRLRVHPLNGKYSGYWSFNVTGYVRAIYRYDGKEVVIFGLIGTHSSLYG